MSVLSEVQKQVATKEVPKIKAGHTVRVHQKIKEGEKERIQMFEGLVIKVNSGTGADKTFTVRKVVEGIGVERIFPLYSPLLEKIEVKKEAKVRRSKLYYMRKRSGKSARLKEGFVTDQEMEAAIVQLADEKAKEEEENTETAETNDAPAETKEEDTAAAEAEVETTPEAEKAEEAPVEEKVEEKTD